MLKTIFCLISKPEILSKIAQTTVDFCQSKMLQIHIKSHLPLWYHYTSFQPQLLQIWSPFGKISHISWTKDKTDALLCQFHMSVCLWIMDLGRRAREKNAGLWEEMLPKAIEQFVQGPCTCNQWGGSQKNLSSHWRIWWTPDPGTETEVKMVKRVWPRHKVFCSGWVVRWCWGNFQCRGVLQFG